MGNITQQLFNNQTLVNKKKNTVLPEIIAITSGKGGVGKTNISVNLAILLSKYGRKVLLIDADIHLGNVDVMCGISPGYSLIDVFNKTKSLKDILVSTPYGFDFLPATSGVVEMIEGEEHVLASMSEAFATVHHSYDIVLVDTGAGLAKSTLTFVLGSDKVLLVVTPEPASISDAYAMIKIIKQKNQFMPIMMVTNRTESEKVGHSLFNKMNLIVNRFLKSSILFGGTILEDERIGASVNAQQPVVHRYPNSKAVQNMQLLGLHLLKLPSINHELRTNFFNRLKKQRKVIENEELIA